MIAKSIDLIVKLENVVLMKTEFALFKKLKDTFVTK
jgi:hypothetical protein